MAFRYFRQGGMPKKPHRFFLVPARDFLDKGGCVCYDFAVVRQGRERRREDVRVYENLHVLVYLYEQALRIPGEARLRPVV